MSRIMKRRGGGKNDHPTAVWSVSRKYRYLLTKDNDEREYWRMVQKWKEWAAGEEVRTGEKPAYSKTWIEVAKQNGYDIPEKKDLQRLVEEKYDAELRVQAKTNVEVARRLKAQEQLKQQEEVTWTGVFETLKDGSMGEYEQYYAWALRHPALHRQRNLPSTEKVVLTGEDILGAPSKIAVNILAQAIDNPNTFFNRAHDVGKMAQKEASKQIEEVQSEDMTLKEIDELIRQSLEEE